LGYPDNDARIQDEGLGFAIRDQDEGFEIRDRDE
jgi:hypothetical protein